MSSVTNNIGITFTIALRTLVISGEFVHTTYTLKQHVLPKCGVVSLDSQYALSRLIASYPVGYQFLSSFL